MTTTTAAVFHAYVDHSLGISFQVGCNQSVLLHNNTLIPIGMLHGLNTVPSTVQYNCSFSSFGLVFYPHVIKEIFGMDACHFTNAQISIEDHIEPFLTEEVVTAANSRKRIEIITAYLLNKLNKKTEQGALAKNFIHYIQSNGGILTVKDLVSAFNTTERQIERLFKEQVGVTPRHFIKTEIFQKALQQIAANTTSLTDIAYSLQYADQSHFIRHVRQLSGLSPKQLQKKYQKTAINIIL